MTEPNKDPKGWKEALLKSSLPLELVVAHMLGEEGWNVGGQYTYSRANESGEDVDFSVDVVAERSLSESDPRLELKMLVECKYVSPGAQWIFSPYPDSAVVDAGLVKVVDEGAHIRVIDRRTLVAFEDEMPFCVRGVQLNTGAFDETNIFRGLSQLRHAMPVVVKDEIALQYFSAQHDEGYASFCCAVLVTPAPLFHLREGLGLDDFYAAKTLSEVAEEVPWLIVWEGDAPSRSRYADGQYRALLSDEAIWAAT